MMEPGRSETNRAKQKQVEEANLFTLGESDLTVAASLGSKKFKKRGENAT